MDIFRKFQFYANADQSYMCVVIGEMSDAEMLITAVDVATGELSTEIHTQESLYEFFEMDQPVPAFTKIAFDPANTYMILESMYHKIKKNFLVPVTDAATLKRMNDFIINEYETFDKRLLT